MFDKNKPDQHFTIFWHWRKYADAAFKRTHSLFLHAREPVCAISLGARDLALFGGIFGSLIVRVPRPSSILRDLYQGKVLLYWQISLNLKVKKYNANILRGKAERRAFFVSFPILKNAEWKLSPNKLQNLKNKSENDHNKDKSILK